tara:strand:+ start:22 stop:885 length:864 start_codon:yes stop_codon:yes gene_type:complete
MDGSATPLSTRQKIKHTLRHGRAPKAIPINEKCVEFLRDTISLRNWWERELYRWKYLWKNHTFYIPEVDEDNKISLDLENRTIKGEELLTNISEDELLNSLDQLISEYEQATDSDECKKIKRENNFIYKQILFFTNYDHKMLELVIGAQNKIEGSYGDPDDPNYEWFEKLMTLQLHAESRQYQRSHEERNPDKTHIIDDREHNQYHPIDGIPLWYKWRNLVATDRGGVYADTLAGTRMSRKLKKKSRKMRKKVLKKKSIKMRKKVLKKKSIKRRKKKRKSSGSRKKR